MADLREALEKIRDMCPTKHEQMRYPAETMRAVRMASVADAALSAPPEQPEPHSWHPCPIHGYEQRINEQGYLETRPVTPPGVEQAGSGQECTARTALRDLLSDMYSPDGRIVLPHSRELANAQDALRAAITAHLEPDQQAQDWIEHHRFTREYPKELVRPRLVVIGPPEKLESIRLSADNPAIPNQSGVRAWIEP